MKNVLPAEGTAGGSSQFLQNVFMEKKKVFGERQHQNANDILFTVNKRKKNACNFPWK